MMYVRTYIVPWHWTICVIRTCSLSRCATAVMKLRNSHSILCYKPRHNPCEAAVEEDYEEVLECV